MGGLGARVKLCSSPSTLPHCLYVSQSSLRHYRTLTGKRKMKGQTETYFLQRKSVVRPGGSVYTYTPPPHHTHTHTHTNTTTGKYSVSSQLSHYKTEGSVEESGGWAKRRQAAGRKPFTQTLNKVPQESFQLSAEEE